MRYTSLLIVTLLAGLLAGPAAQRPAGETVTVDVMTVISTIEHPFWGVNYVAFWDGLQGSAQSRQALKNAGVQIIRFPGGEPANWMDWSKTDGPPYWTSTSTDDLWAYARGAGAELLLQTNPTANTISDDGQVNDPAGARAGAWAAYTRSRGVAARYWEVGNEPDIHIDDQPEVLARYLDTFGEHATAIKRANPEARVFGPVGTNAYQWWRRGSLDLFLQRHGNRQGSGLADGVSLHYYPIGGCLERHDAWQRVRSVAQEWPPAMDYIRRTIAQHDTRRLPVFISETNAAVGAMDCPFNVNTTVAAALANADLLGAYRDSGVQAVQLYGAIHSVSAWGLLYSASEARPAGTPTPTYFTLPIWTRAGNQVLRVTGPSDFGRTLSAYASRRPDGSVQVVLINKTDRPLPVTVRFRGFDPSGRQVRVSELRPASGDVLDTDVVYNGVRTPDPAGRRLPPPTTVRVSGATYTHTAPAYSLTLLDF